jgi:NAD(P)-dependent dehydrogenase (short-subunit alcohol dehydrogenase family)
MKVCFLFPSLSSLCNFFFLEQSESVAEGISQVVKEYGGIDVLVNCAGFVKDELFVNKPRANWKKEVPYRRGGRGGRY